MKVRRTITIDSKLDKRITDIIDREISKRIEKGKITSKKIREIQKEVNFSAVVEKLIKKGLEVV